MSERVPAGSSKYGRPTSRRALTPPQPPVPKTPPVRRRHPAEPAERPAWSGPALYRDGRRVVAPAPSPRPTGQLREQPGAMAWIGLYRPTEAELHALAAEFDLHELAVEDAIARPPAAQARALRRHPVRRAARRPLPRRRRGGRVRRAARLRRPATSSSPSGTARRPTCRRCAAGWRRTPSCSPGPEAVLYAILDAVVDGYAPVVAGLQNDIDEIETEVFGGDPEVSRRIYELSREVVEFQRATRPLVGMLDGAARGLRQVRRRRGAAALPARRRRPRHQVIERVDGFRRAAARHPHRQRHPGRPAAERGDARAQPSQLRAERGGQEDLRLGGDPVRAHPGRHRSTA